MTLDSLLFKILAACATWYECDPKSIDPSASECHITGLSGSDGTTLYTLARYSNDQVVLCCAVMGVPGWRRVGCPEDILVALRSKMNILPGRVDVSDATEYDK